MNVHARITAIKILVLLLGLAGTARAATPPSEINYQGVLRDLADNPENGAKDMTFRFYDTDGGGCPAAGGALLLTDDHTGGSAVTVGNGMFNVRLGSGAITPGTESDLAEVFRDNASVFLEVEIAGDLLCPRTPVASAPYAINAGKLDGREASEYIDTSSTMQTKAGWLSVSTLTVSNGFVRLGGTSFLSHNSGQLWLQTQGLQSDDLMLQAGNAFDDGHIYMYGDSDMELLAGNGNFGFYNGATSVQTALLSGGGDLQIGGDLTVNGGELFGISNLNLAQDLTVTGNDILFGSPGARINATPSYLFLNAGDADTDDIYIYAGNSPDDGEIFLSGDAEMRLRAGNGSFQFWNGANATQTAGLDSLGNLQIDGDLLTSGDVLSSLGNAIEFSGTTTTIRGDATSDRLFLYAGADAGSGGMRAYGDGILYLDAGNGVVSFRNRTGAGDVETASINASGNLQIDGDLTADGGTIRFPGGQTVDSTVGYTLLSGDLDTDDLFLYAGNTPDDGALSIVGDGSLSLISGNGSFIFANGASGSTTTATLDGAGNLQIDGDLTVSGDDILFGGGGAIETSTGFMRLEGDAAGDDLYLQTSSTQATGSLVFFGGASTTLRSAGTFFLYTDSDNNDTSSWFRVYTDTSTEQMRIEAGNEAPTYFDGTVNANGIDYAEAFRVEDPTLEAGDVVVSMPGAPGFIERSSESYSTRLLGVISERPGYLTGNSFEAEEAADVEIAAMRREARIQGDEVAEKDYTLQLIAKKNERQRAVALLGRVPVKVDGSYGPIRAGDHLTSSPTPGHAMVMTAPGSSIGIALEGWEREGRGKILTFINLSHFTPPEMIAATEQATRDLEEAVDDRTPDPATGIQSVAGNLQIVLDRDADDQARFSIFRDGDERGSLGAEIFRVDEDGNVYAKGSFRPSSMDVAEYFPLSGIAEAGDVLVADRESPGRYTLAREAADPAVVGVVSEEPGVLLGSWVSRIATSDAVLADRLALARETGDREAEAAAWNGLQAAFRRSHAPVALTGTVDVKVDAGFGAIAVGDLLTTSPTAGHAMRADDPRPGTILGKALEPLAAGSGTIRVLVMLR